jgi:catechol 2,3-dioxygenase-like lactoylglutathione lyase family enzyme
MAVPSRLTLVTLGARDAPALADFYRRVGWQEGPSADDGFCAFLLNNVVIAVYPIESLGAEAAPGEPAPTEGWRGVTLAINVESPEAVDRTWQAFVDAGATPVLEPRTMEWGGRSSYVADPEGNRWEVAWNSGLVTDENGVVERFGDSVRR